MAKKYTVALPREDVPRAGKELENVQITAYVQGARCEEDGDYHLVLSDSTIATAPRANVCMVTEFPVPTEGTDEDRKPLMHARDLLFEKLHIDTWLEKTDGWRVPRDNIMVTIVGSLCYESASDIADNGTTSIVRLLTRDDQLSRTPNRWCRSIRRSCPIRPTRLGLVSSFRLCYGLLDFSAAVRTLVDEVNLRHAPMGLDVSYVHRKS